MSFSSISSDQSEIFFLHVEKREGKNYLSGEENRSVEIMGKIRGVFSWCIGKAVRIPVGSQYVYVHEDTAKNFLYQYTSIEKEIITALQAKSVVGNTNLSSAILQSLQNKPFSFDTKPLFVSKLRVTPDKKYLTNSNIQIETLNSIKGFFQWIFGKAIKINIDDTQSVYIDTKTAKEFVQLNISTREGTPSQISRVSYAVLHIFENSRDIDETDTSGDEISDTEALDALYEEDILQKEIPLDELFEPLVREKTTEIHADEWQEYQTQEHLQTPRWAYDFIPEDTEVDIDRLITTLVHLEEIPMEHVLKKETVHSYIFALSQMRGKNGVHDVYNLALSFFDKLSQGEQEVVMISAQTNNKEVYNDLVARKK